MKFNFKLKFIFREIFSRPVYSIQFILAVIIGVSSVVGINSYRENLYGAINRESRNIMGGDLLIEASSPLTSEQNQFIAEKLPAGSKVASQVFFSSMIYTDEKETSLASVKAQDKAYPLYGKIITKPENLSGKLRNSETLLEENLAKNLKIKPGDSVYIGSKKFRLKGFILKEPGTVGSFLSMAPSAIITIQALKETGLEARGSRIRYNTLVSLPEGLNSKQYKEEHFKDFIKKDLTLYYNNEIGSGSQRFINSTFDYMSLLGLSAFFLGSICILISTRTRLSQKREEIAVLKCIGANSWWNISIFISEILLLSIIGTLIGFLFGYYFQFYIPDLTGSEFLLELKPALTMKAVFWGLFIGLFIPFLLALESIVRINRISPLAAIRSDISEKIAIKFIPDLIQFIEILLVYSAFFLLASHEAGGYFKGFILSVVLIVLPLLLTILYMLLRVLSLKSIKIAPSSNTFRLVLRKINQTGSGLFLPIIGIGSALTILLLSIFIKFSLMNLSGANQTEKRPNVFTLDIRQEQLPFLENLQKKYSADLVLTSPVIGARLATINGKRIQKEDTEENAVKRDWKSTAKTREYFLSYRKDPYKTESVLEGKFWENKGFSELSIEYEFAKTLGVKVGDTLEFNIQGIEVGGKITNTRSVNWSDMKPNFVVIFSPGVLEHAPAYHISSFRIEDSEKRYEFQKELVAESPNITVIDIEKAILNFTSIMEKVSSVINLMTGFILSSAILLLISSLYSTHSQRKGETSLFRILGADRSFIVRAYSYEAIILANYSFFSSLLIAFTANYILSKHFLNLRIIIPAADILTAYIAVNLLILAVYLSGIYGIFKSLPGRFAKD